MKNTIEPYINFFTYWQKYLLSKFKYLFLSGLVSAFFGFLIFKTQKTYYKAKISFSIDSESSTNQNNLSGLTNQFGFNTGASSTSIFEGQNLQDLMTSRSLIQEALMDTVYYENKFISLIDYYILKNINNSEIVKGNNTDVLFGKNFELEKLDLKHRELFGSIYRSLISSNILSFISVRSALKVIEVRSTDELFAKKFCESLINATSDMYSEIKTRKTKNDLLILQAQADSIRKSLNNVISGVALATDEVFNLNSALSARGSNTTKKSVDIQVNTSILYSLITNIETVKLNIRKLEPFIKVIDKPMIPLETNELLSRTRLIISSFIFGLIFSSFIFILVKLYKINIQSKIQIENNAI